MSLHQKRLLAMALPEQPLLLSLPVLVLLCGPLFKLPLAFGQANLEFYASFAVVQV
jgi:hypothetical protein